MSKWNSSWLHRAVALLQIALLLSAGCTGGPLHPAPGAAEHQEPGLLRVPGGRVNAAGGNLIVERTDVTLDGVVAGAVAIGAVYNSSVPGWTWSFGLRYDGSSFLDPTGGRHDVSALADGAAIPGTFWVKVDADTMQTKGGLAHDFDAQGRLASVRWATLEHPRLRFTWSAAALDLAQCTAAVSCTGFFRVDLDAQQRPLAVTDLRAGRRAEYGWDAEGRLVLARSPLEVAKGWTGTRYAYAGAGRLAAITSSEGERTEYEYDAAGRTVRVTQVGEGDPTHRFAYYAKGSDGLYATLYTNPLGARTRLAFDPQARLAEVERLESGERRAYAWEGLRVASVTLENGATMAYVWLDDDPVAITDPGGNQIAIAYAAGALNQESPRARAVARVEDSLGLVEERTYDGSGRLVRAGNGEGEAVEIAYNGVSLVASLTEPTGSVQNFPLYGQHGHWLDMDGAVSDKRSFDPAGDPRVESAKGRRGGVLSQQFDANRWLSTLNVAATDASGVTGTGVVTVERRSDGQPTAIRRPYGGDHELGYDALGRLAWQRERVDGAWRTTVFERDLAGNAMARTRPNGMREEWQYDGYGRVVRYRTLRDGSLEGEAVFVWENGQLVSSFDSVRNTLEQHAYDAAGRLVLTTFGYGETRALGYDLRSRVVAETLVAGGQALFDLGFEYDLANRLVRTIDRAGEEMLVERVFGDGELVETRYGNGLVRTYAYDAAGLLVASETRDATGGLVESTSIERTGGTSPLRLAVKASTLTPLAETEEEYWLSPGEQLSDPGKRVFGWVAGPDDVRSYAYDELSNRLSVPGGQSYSYNAERNRLLAAGGTTYTYDEAGFATSRGGVPIAWTAAGRLASYGSATAGWDLSGRLVALDFDGDARRFDLFGGRIESDASTGAVGPLDLGEVSLSPFSGARKYRHFDFRWNVSFVTDDSAQVINHYRYGPYGLAQEFGPGENGNTFVGKPSAGPFLLLGARVYDPAVGRFLSQDPHFNLTNQYVYTSGNPVGFSDASGLYEISNRQATAVSKAVGWVVTTGISVAAAAASTNPILVAATIAAAVATGFPVAMELLDAFTVDSAGGPSSLPPATEPAPPPPDPPPSGGDQQQQEKRLEFQLTGLPAMSARVSVVQVDSPASTCSPSTLAQVESSGWLIGIVLAANVILGLGWLRSHRRRRWETTVRV